MQRLWAPWRMTYIANDKEDGCIFCKKLHNSNDRDMLILHRGKHTLIMLNKYPYTNGHLMVAPKRHVKGLEDLQEVELNELMLKMQRAVALLKKALSPDGINIGANVGKAAGAGVEDHIHFHILTDILTFLLSEFMVFAMSRHYNLVKVGQYRYSLTHFQFLPFWIARSGKHQCAFSTCPGD